MQLLKYGMQNGSLIHIDKVSNGLSCNCTCPNCGNMLEAHQGSVNQHHFKHYNAVDCKYGSETALHIMAKNIIYTTKCVYIPNEPKNIYDLNPKGKLYQFSKAYMEKDLSSGIRCDVLLEHGLGSLNVEIKVTHKVDEQKKFKLFNENIRTIEIDLSEFVNDFNDEKITHIIQSGYHTKLIYSPKAKDIYAKWWLSDIKEIFRDRVGNQYVKKCRYSDGKAITYFASMGQAYRSDHTSNECFYCSNGAFIPQNENATHLFCCDLYGNLNFADVEKIIEIEQKKGIVQYAAIIVKGKLMVFGKKK